MQLRVYQVSNHKGLLISLSDVAYGIFNNQGASSPELNINEFYSGRKRKKR